MLRMTHDERCASAKGDNCTCECSGNLHGISRKSEEERNSDRKQYIGKPGGKCVKCDGVLHTVDIWKDFYCNYFCCSPCCPDSHTSPCTKEMIENSNDEAEIALHKMTMKKNLLTFGALDRVQETLKKFLESVRK